MGNKMKKTSIDWLAEQLRQRLTVEVNNIGHDSVTFGMKQILNHMEQHLQIARKMHREEVEGAYEAGFYDDMEDGKDFDTKYYTRNFETP